MLDTRLKKIEEHLQITTDIKKYFFMFERECDYVFNSPEEERKYIRMLIEENIEKYGYYTVKGSIVANGGVVKISAAEVEKKEKERNIKFQGLKTNGKGLTIGFEIIAIEE